MQSASDTIMPRIAIPVFILLITRAFLSAAAVSFSFITSFTSSLVFASSFAFTFSFVTSFTFTSSFTI